MIATTMLAVLTIFFLMFLFVMTDIQDDYWDVGAMFIINLALISFMFMMVQNAGTFSIVL